MYCSLISEGTVVQYLWLYLALLIYKRETSSLIYESVHCYIVKPSIIKCLLKHSTKSELTENPHHSQLDRFSCMASYSRPVTYHHYSLLFIKHFCWKTKRTVRLYFTKIYSQSKSSRKRRKNEFERKKLKLAEKSWAHHVLSQQLGKKELFCPANMELATKNLLGR